MHLFTGSEGVFRRFYVCFGGIKEGFQKGCRPVIGLDGCHLKGKYQGQLLTAVSIDADNCMFPVAYGVVEIEKEESWAWFLDLLIGDLSIRNGFGWTFMSDRQKGLINAIERLLPTAEHRHCVRHMHNNFRQKFKGKSLKDKMWAVARATTVEYYESGLEAVKIEDNGAYNWLKACPPQTWSRAYFQEDSRCDILLNNNCEAFNKALLFARDQGILVMLEMIRDYLMVRFLSSRNKAARWRTKLCPKILKIIDKNKIQASNSFPTHAGMFPCFFTCLVNTIMSSFLFVSISKSVGYMEFKVGTISGNKYAVNLLKKTCGCRRWQLTGLPCPHAISSINYMHKNVDDFVNPCYTVEAYKKCYTGITHPVNGSGNSCNSLTTLSYLLNSFILY